MSQPYTRRAALAILLAFLLSGCKLFQGSDSSQGSSSAAATATDLEGTWVQGCQLTAGGQLYKTVTIAISQSTMTHTAKFYQNANCSGTEQWTEVLKGPLTIGGPAPTVAAARKIDFKIEEVSLPASSANNADAPKVGQVIYSIIKVDGSQAYFGEPVGYYNESSEAKRSVVLEAKPFEKQ